MFGTPTQSQLRRSEEINSR